MNDITDKLKSNKLKVTPQRLAIYTYLTNTNSHPSAETIYTSLKSDYPTMSLATVYKTVSSLRDANLIQELNVGEDSFRYDAETKFHPHLICVKCNEVFDYYNSINLDDIKRNITNNTEFKLLYEQMYFYGICKHCQEKENN